MKAKLITVNYESKYNQIFQSLELKFSFVNKVEEGVFKQMFDIVKCRDYLADCAHSRNLGISINVFGFEFDYKETPLDEDKFRMMIKFPNNTSMENFKKNIDYIHNKEKIAGVSETEIIETEDKSVLIIEADPIWQQTAWKISLYTFFLKVASYPSLDEIQYPEREYMGVYNNVNEKKFLSNVKKITSDYVTATLDKFLLHNRTGFYSILRGVHPSYEITKLMGG